MKEKYPVIPGAGDVGFGDTYGRIRRSLEDHELGLPPMPPELPAYEPRRERPVPSRAMVFGFLIGLGVVVGIYGVSLLVR